MKGLILFILSSLNLSLSASALIAPRSTPYSTHRLSSRSNCTSGNKVEPSAGCKECVSSLTFKGAEAKKYLVGSQIPTMPFKTKNSWAGNMPISNNKNETYYFWFWGKDDTKPNKDVVIWIHGGPTCSSLIAMLTQSGPFIYPSLDKKPQPNPNSWTKQANMLYVEQPIGVGFTTGDPTSQEKAQFANQFAGFLDNFFITFPELAGGNVYFAGESYAGVYLSYIMAKQYELGNKHNVKGALFIDTLISDPVVQADLVTYDFAVKNSKTIGFTKSDLAAIKKQSDKCKYTDYVEKYLKYPAAGKLPDINREGCDTYPTYDTLARKRKADYNVYRINTPPSFPEIPPPTSPLDDSALQTYIHASPHPKWNYCDNLTDLTNWAPSPDQFPSFDHNVLQQTIEKSSSGVIIMQGQQDARLIEKGTAIVLQNLTWNGAQGFHTAPNQKLIDINGKATGTFAQERGLTYAIVPDAGHMIDSDAPATALAALKTLLGERKLSG